MTLEQSIEKHPLVAINCMVYNHEPYLRKCLDGFVMQQTTFPVVAFVHDDCSTDSSAAIIAEYAEKYPDIICPMYEEENQYQYNHRTARIVEKACVESGAKYIAECEGDDYWTHPLKLQKQVDFMENHPDYSACWHNFSICDTSTGVISERKLNYKHTIEMVDGGCDFDTYMYLHGMYGGQPLTLLYRVSMYDFNCRDKYKYFKDVHHAYLLLKQGKGYYMDFDGATYHQHADSATNKMSKIELSNSTKLIFYELYLKHKNDNTLEVYLLDVLLWNYVLYKGDTKQFYDFIKNYFFKTPLFFTRVFIKILKHYLTDINDKK